MDEIKRPKRTVTLEGELTKDVRFITLYLNGVNLGSILSGKLEGINDFPNINYGKVRVIIEEQ